MIRITGVVIAVFMAELLMMTFLRALDATESLVGAAADALLLSLVVVATAYPLLIAPFRAHIQQLTEQRRRMDDQKALLTSLIEAMPTPVFYKDAELRYLGCNKAFEQFLGLPRQRIIGHSVFDVAPPELADTYAEADAALFAEGGSQVYEAAVRSQTGKERTVVFHKAVFTDSAGDKAGIIGIMLDVTERKEQERELRFLSSHDPLTGLVNRSEFMNHLGQALLRAKRAKSTLALLFLDLDGFKEINDLFGHQAGDDVLRMVAQRLGECLREADLAGRHGGDEFTVLLEGVSGADNARTVADKVCETLAAPYPLTVGETRLSASIGIALYPCDANDVDALLRAADTAMYQAKMKGKNAVETAS